MHALESIIQGEHSNASLRRSDDEDDGAVDGLICWTGFKIDREALKKMSLDKGGDCKFISVAKEVREFEEVFPSYVCSQKDRASTLKNLIARRKKTKVESDEEQKQERLVFSGPSFGDFAEDEKSSACD